jgi:hypothetical protein
MDIQVLYLVVSVIYHAADGFTSLQCKSKIRSSSANSVLKVRNAYRPIALHASVVAAVDEAQSFDDEINNKNTLIIELDKNNDSVLPDASVSGIANSTAMSTKIPRIWPCGDELDRRLILLSLPVIANFAIGPLIGAVDLFWVNRMGDALAVAGQAAANQVFNSVFWLTSFLPSVTATLISKENAQNNAEGVQDAVCQAIVVGVFMALVSSIVLLRFPEQVLGSVLPSGAPALQYAKPYLLIRSFAFIPALISLVGFSAFRGILDTLTPVKISLFANVFNAILDPILIFTFAMGVPGGTQLKSKLISCMSLIILPHISGHTFRFAQPHLPR